MSPPPHHHTAAETGRPAAPEPVARKLPALFGCYDYGVHDTQVLTHSPPPQSAGPGVSDESQAVGLTADELRLLLGGRHSGDVI